MPEPSDLTAPPVSPLEALAAELGADVARIERELKLTMALEIERLRAETATQMLALGDRIEAKAAELRAAVPPPAEPEMPPDDIAPMVAKALALVAEPLPAPPQPPAVVNVTVPLPQSRTERSRVRHDEHGRIVEIERDVA